MNISRRDNILGITFSFLYSIISAASLVLLSRYLQTFDMSKLAFYNFVFATLFFSFMSLASHRSIIHLIKHNFRLVIILNLATILAWATIFYGLKYVEPAVFLGVVFGVLPITSILITISLREIFSRYRYDLYFALTSFFITCILIFYYVFVTYYSKSQFKWEIYFSLFLAIAAGVGLSLCLIYMKKLSNQHFSAAQVMAARFYLMIIFTMILMLFTHVSFTISLKEFGYLLIIAIFTIILPLYLNQKGIEYTSAVNVSFIIPLQPVITYGLQMFDNRLHLSWPIFILILLLSTSIILSAFYKARHVIRGSKSLLRDPPKTIKS